MPENHIAMNLKKPAQHRSAKLNALGALSLLVALAAVAQSNPNPQPLPYSQDFSGLASSSSTYPDGWQGWTNATAPSSSFITAGPIADKTLTASGTANNNGIGVYNYNGKIGFLNGAAADMSVALALNTSGFVSV